MDFKRIQWIFLVAFIAIDIFLGYTFLSNNDFRINVQQPSRDDTIISEMKADGIETRALSSKQQAGFYISSTGSDILEKDLSQLTDVEAHYADGVLTANLNNPVKINANSPEKTLDKILLDKNKVLFGSQYVYDESLSSDYDNDVVYVQKGPALNVFSTDGQIRFRVNSQNQIISYTQSYLNNIKTLREKTKTVSERKAVLYLYQHGSIPNSSKVKWARLGYTKLISLDDDNSVYIPTWLVAVQSKNSDSVEIKKVNAFTGTLSTTDTSTINQESDSSK